MSLHRKIVICGGGRREGPPLAIRVATALQDKGINSDKIKYLSKIAGGSIEGDARPRSRKTPATSGHHESPVGSRIPNTGRWHTPVVQIATREKNSRPEQLHNCSSFNTPAYGNKTRLRLIPPRKRDLLATQSHRNPYIHAPSC